MEDEDVRVSVLANEQDVHLLREIARWRRNHDVTYFQWRPGVGFGVFTEWYRYVNGNRRTVSYEPESDIGGAARLLATVDYYGGRELQRLPVRTVTEAVDVLVALGFLPARFSSAYRSGWDAATVWEKCEGDESTFKRLFHDPENISFPAVEAAF
jgi:hypothetical protein